MDQPGRDAPAPENPALKANFNRLRGGLSIEALRLAMKDGGYKIGTETLQRASLGKSGNRLASLKKMADYWDVTPDQLLQPNLGADTHAWPFTDELQKRISQLGPDDLVALENAMWSHLKEPAPDVVQERLRAARDAFIRQSQPLGQSESTQKLKRTS